jgi:hypothetical protein
MTDFAPGNFQQSCLTGFLYLPLSATFTSLPVEEE